MIGRHHARILQSNPAMRFAGAVDPGGDRFGAVRDPAAVHDTLDALLAAGVPDFAVVAVPTEEHVGAGPFPSELHEETGEEIRQKGGEFGTTTGRARRTGWLDVVALRYAARLNSLSALAVTKLDVLSGFDTLKVCTQYRGTRDEDFVTDTFPYHQSVLHHAEGVYTELPGWSEDLTGIRSYEDLPENAKKYLAYLEEAVGVPVVLIGVGNTSAV